MVRNPDELFIAEIGCADTEAGGEEVFNLFYDFGTFDFVVRCTCFSASIPNQGREEIHESTYGIRAFLARVPDAEPVVRQLILEKFHAARAAREAAERETVDDLTMTPNVEVRGVRLWRQVEADGA